jgi:hypothetical protein
MSTYILHDWEHLVETDQVEATIHDGLIWTITVPVHPGELGEVLVDGKGRDFHPIVAWVHGFGPGPSGYYAGGPNIRKTDDRYGAQDCRQELDADHLRQRYPRTWQRLRKESRRLAKRTGKKVGGFVVPTDDAMSLVT